MTPRPHKLPITDDNPIFLIYILTCQPHCDSIFVDTETFILSLLEQATRTTLHRRTSHSFFRTHSYTRLIYKLRPLLNFPIPHSPPTPPFPLPNVICMSDDLNSPGRRLTVLFSKLHGPHTNHKHWPTKDVNNCRATYMYMLYTLVKLFTSNRQQFIGKSRVKNVNKRTGHVHASGWPYECATCDWSNAIWAAKANNMS